jgi:hypothetical protein
MEVRAREFDMKTTEPVRPDEDVDQETEEIVRDRNASFETDKKTAAPWSEVKRRILSQPLPN